VPSRFIEPEEAARLAPGLFVDDLSGAAYNASDAKAGPNEAAQAFARRARERGVQIREGVEVTGIEVTSGRVRAVHTAAGVIETETVVIAAGAWSRGVAALAGVDVPVHPYRRTIFMSEPFPMPKPFPLVLDIHAGWTLTREGDGARISGQTDSHQSFDRSVDWSHLEKSAEHAVHRYPPLRDARFGKRGYAGTYDTTPDNHGIIGAAPEVEGLYVCAGFSGHGFQHSPASGRAMAELVLDGSVSGLDISALALTRFRDGSPLWEPLTAYAGSHVRSNS